MLSIILPRQKSAGLRMAGDSIEKATTDRKQVLSLDGVLYIGKLVFPRQGWRCLRTGLYSSSLSCSSGRSNPRATHLVSQWMSPGYMYDSAGKILQGSIRQSLSAKCRNNLTLHGSFGILPRHDKSRVGLCSNPGYLMNIGHIL